MRTLVIQTGLKAADSWPVHQSPIRGSGQKLYTRNSNSTGPYLNLNLDLKALRFFPCFSLFSYLFISFNNETENEWHNISISAVWEAVSHNLGRGCRMKEGGCSEVVVTCQGSEHVHAVTILRPRRSQYTDCCNRGCEAQPTTDIKLGKYFDDAQ